MADNQFLDGTNGPHWCTYHEAASVATELALAKEKTLHQKIRALRKMRRHLITDDARDTVVSKPFKVVDLSDAEHRARTRCLKRVKSPTGYPQPGEMIYIVVTSNVQTSEFEYRPHESFILEVPISSIWFTPDGTVHVGFSNLYRVDKYFPTREAATKAHPAISTFVSHEEFVKGETEFELAHPVF